MKKSKIKSYITFYTNNGQLETIIQLDFQMELKENYQETSTKEHLTHYMTVFT